MATLELEVAAALVLLRRRGWRSGRPRKPSPSVAAWLGLSLFCLLDSTRRTAGSAPGRPTTLPPARPARLALPPMVTFSRGADQARWLHLRFMEGCHSPRHVHVYRDRSLVVKWDLDNGVAMVGKASARILKLIAELVAEGLL